MPFRDICLAVWRECGHFPPFEIHIPKTVAAIFGFLAEVVTYMTGTSTTLSRGSVLDACAIRYCNGEKARRLLGYKPRVGLEEGIRISCAVSIVTKANTPQALTASSLGYVGFQTAAPAARTRFVVKE